MSSFNKLFNILSLLFALFRVFSHKFVIFMGCNFLVDISNMVGHGTHLLLVIRTGSFELF